MPRCRLFGSIFVVVFAYGCSGDDDGKVVPANACKPASSRCDIAERDCVKDLLELTACVRENEVPPLPKVEYLSAREAGERLAEMIEERGMRTATPWDPALRALALLPEGASSVEVAISQFVESVAAYYDVASQSITIITDPSRETDELSRMYVLSHELTHYLQDREHDLEQMTEESRGTTDRSVALSSLVEGDAVVTSTRVLIRLMERSSNNFAWERYFGALQGDMLEEIEASPAPLATAVQDLPYSVGGLAVALRWNARGRAGVDELFDTPPRAVLDWLGQSLDPDESLIKPLACAPPLAPSGFRLYEVDSFGATGALALLVAAGATDLEHAGALRNDAIALYVTADAEDIATAPVIAVWRLQFANSERAAAFEAAIEGMGPAVELRRRGAELTIRAGSGPEASALSGDELDACPELEELEPESDAPDMPRALLRGLGMPVR